MESTKLMEGIEVLSVSRGEMPILLGFFLLFLCLVIMVLIVYAMISAVNEGFPGGIIICLALIVLTICLAGMVIDRTFCRSEVYKVLIDDSVPLNKFYENYNILDIDGKIYTIEPKGAK